MSIQNGQIAYIVHDLRNSNMSPKSEKVRDLMKRLQSAVRQAEIVDNKCFGDLEENITKILNKVGTKTEVKKNSIDNLLGFGIRSEDFENYAKGTKGKVLFEQEDWQAEIARGVRNALKQ